MATTRRNLDGDLWVNNSVLFTTLCPYVFPSLFVFWLVISILRMLLQLCITFFSLQFLEWFCEFSSNMYVRVWLFWFGVGMWLVFDSDVLSSELFLLMIFSMKVRFPHFFVWYEYGALKYDSDFFETLMDVFFLLWCLYPFYTKRLGLVWWLDA